MKHRILLIGDSWWGQNPGSADLLANFLLIKYPKLPLTPYINSNSRNTLDKLFENSARDIIGLQAGSLVLCCGFADIHNQKSTEFFCQSYTKLIHELTENSSSHLNLCVLPYFQFHESSIAYQKLQALEQTISQFSNNSRITIINLHTAFKAYEELQAHKKEQIRNLFTEKGELNALGQCLCVQTLQEAIFMD